MTDAFGGWVLDHHAVAAWARVEPYAQALVWSAMEVGMQIRTDGLVGLSRAGSRLRHHGCGCFAVGVGDPPDLGVQLFDSQLADVLDFSLFAAPPYISV